MFSNYNPFKLTCSFAYPVLFLLILLLLPQSSQACDRSDLTLDSVVVVGSDFDLYVTLCIGGGVTGAINGADGNTTDFAFGFYSSCNSTINISSFFPATVVGDTTGFSNIGFNIGPQSQIPFQTQGTVFYQSSTTNNPLLCITSTSQCGNVHTQCEQFRFRTNVVPDSIKVFGIEGNGNPLSGCFNNADMTVALAASSCDNIPPTITCPPTDSIYVNSLCQSILPDYRSQATVNDNLDPNPTVTQSPLQGTTLQGISNQLISLTATDNSFNAATCTFLVEVFDTIPPTATCQNAFLYLGSGGQATVTPSLVNGGSSDNCGNPGETVTPSTFSCSDIGANTVSLFLTDFSGNTSNCTATVTVLDTTGPNAVCQNATVYLDASGNGSITAGMIDGGSSDACGAVTTTVSPSTFNCADLPMATTTLNVTDPFNNTSSCSASVTLIDSVSPSVTCPSNLTVQSTGPGCGSVANWNPATATDNCGTVNLTSSQSSGSYFQTGTTSVTYQAQDPSGNISSCNFDVTVLAPPAVNALFGFAITGPLTFQFTDQSSANISSWQWDFGDGNSSTQTNPLHTYASGGAYTVCLIVSDSCTADTACQALLVVGVDPNVELPEVALFPNPNQGECWLQVSQDGPVDVQVFDVLGRMQQDMHFDAVSSGDRLRLNTDDLADAQYFVVIRGDGWRSVKQMQVRH